MNTKTEMLAVYLLPAIVGFIRLVVTVMLIAVGAQVIPLRWIQILPLIVVGCSLFRMYRLYVDGIPVISMLVPSIIHGILCAVFFKRVPWVQLGILVGIDVLFLFAKGFKPTQIPFQIEGQEEEDDFTDIVD